MAWMMDEYSEMVGYDELRNDNRKAARDRGSEGRFDSTAMGGMYVLREAAKRIKLDLKKSKVVIQGFGNAGMFAFELATRLFGAKVVGISDSEGGIYIRQG